MSEERALVTVFFADVTGSTALGEAMDAEDVRALMGRYYEHARRVLSEHGGTLEKFIGDAVMAVFGLPRAYGDDAERAVAAGLALHVAIAADPVLGGRIALRIGINTGEVVANRDVSGGDFLVTGDVVNVAARLQQHAEPGEVVVGKRTAAAAKAAFVFDDPREMQAKGKALPLLAYPVHGARRARMAPHPAFVGRKTDLAQLELLWNRVAEEGTPQLVTIIAPAGTGKSRLLEEFLGRVGVREEDRTVATAQCLPYGQSLTYWPLRGLLEGLYGTFPERERIATTLATLVHPADATRLADAVLGTLGIDCDGHGASDGDGHGDSAEARREARHEAWRLLAQSSADGGPRVLVFEDLHWASESLLDLVEYVMHPRTRAPLLFIALARPELLDRRPEWGGGLSNATTIGLRPLGDEAVDGVVDGLLASRADALGVGSADALGASVRARIVELSGGNPFFALALAQVAIESAERAGRTGRRMDMNDLLAALPDTVHAAVLARIDLLAPGARAMLQVAAIIGRSFRCSALDALLPNTTPAAFDADLDELLARDMLVPEDRGGYTFRHVLIREVAYGMLPRAQRMRLHAALAEMLSTRDGGDTEFAAFHYRLAVALMRQSAVPQPFPGDVERATATLLRAADLAARAGSPAEARASIQTAIAVAPPGRHLDLYERMGDADPWGEPGAEAYVAALGLWRAQPDAPPIIGARMQRKLLIAQTRGSTFERLDDDTINARISEALALADQAGDESEGWRIRLAGAFWAFRRGEVLGSYDREDVRRQHALARRAAAYFATHGETLAASEALDAVATTAGILGDNRGALDATLSRLGLPDLSPLERGDAHSMAILEYFRLGAYEECLAFAQRVLAQTRPGEPSVWLAHCLASAITSAWLLGRWDDLDTLAGHLDEARMLVGENKKIGLAADYIPVLHVAMARDDFARADALVALMDAAFVASQGTTMSSLHGLRDIVRAIREDDPAQVDLTLIGALPTEGAAVFVGATLLFLTEHGVAVPEHLAHLLAWDASSAVYVRTAREAHALAADDTDALLAAVEDSEAGGMVAHAARMRVVVAGRLCDSAAARAQLERARPVLERLGDRRFLRRLAELEAAVLAH